jgi:hypothetical protein
MDCRTQVAVRTLADLETAALYRRSVRFGYGAKPVIKPAAWVLNMQGAYIAMLIRKGLFVYFPKSKKGELPF